MTKKKKKITASAIREDLLDQLERNGTYGKQYVDLVDDYVELWKTKNLLIADIEERGVAIEYISNTGQMNKKKNDSVGDLLKVNAQMLKLLDSLNIKPSQTEGGMDDEM